jgi:hypothetical protein
VKRVLSLGSLAIVALLAACGDKPQAIDAGKKKPDTQAFQGQDGAYKAAGWTNGDKVSWEAQLKARSQGQNEYSRTAGN